LAWSTSRRVVHLSEVEPPLLDTTQPEDDLPEVQVPPRWPTLLFAGMVFLFDVVFWGVPFVSMMVLTLGNLVLVIRLALAWREPDLRKRRAWSIAVYSFAALAAITITGQMRDLVHGRAERIITACEQYRTKTGRYPETLEQLVPDYLPEIPSAQRSLLTDPRFRYAITGPNMWIKNPNTHVLEYTSVPPLGKTFYVFETREWRFRD
jgi:hypothetical protein